MIENLRLANSVIFGYFYSMTVKDLEREVSRLPPDQLTQFRHWFEDFDARKWDDQILADVDSGKLDSLADQALKDFDSGKCSKL